MQVVIKIFLLTVCLTQTVFAGKGFVFSVVSLDQATKKIIARNESKILDAKTEVIEGKEVHIIKILTPDGRVQYIKVDAGTGKIVK
jgi:uncharacterized membrane protein YkoI